MKIQFRLMSCLMAIAMLAACTNDEASPIGDVQKPVAGEAVKVKAYVPDDAPDSRVIFTETEQTISLTWEDEENFSVIRGSENQTFSKTAEGNVFSGTLPTVGTGSYCAIYPKNETATDATAVPFDLSTQTGLLNSGLTYMRATSTDGETYQFSHLTAILKATFSGLPTDATVSKVVVTTVDNKVDGTVNLEDGTITAGSSKDITINYAIVAADDDAHYIYLPPMTAANKALSFQVYTSDGYIYSGDLSGGTKNIEAGKVYTASVALTKEIPYLTFSAATEQTFFIRFGPSTLYQYFEYSVGDDQWKGFTSNAIDFGGNLGDLCLRGKSEKGTAEAFDEYSLISFVRDVDVACTGDIRTLVDWENHATASTSNARFYFLFDGCEQLTSAPALPAMELAEFCYFHMFGHCTSLATAPVLPAMNLARGCYYNMFFGCTSLTSAPALKAATLKEDCYSGMFNGCSGLNSITMLATDINANECLYEWVNNVAISGTFTKAAGMTSLPTGAAGIPSGWTVQDYASQP